MPEKRRALIFGISGQDGAWLARLLLDKGYAVHGTSRDAAANPFAGLRRLGLLGKVRLRSCSLTDLGSVRAALAAARPDEVYNLSGQSSVGLSFEQPLETFNSVALATLNVLEALRGLRRPPRFYNAASGECFGDTAGRRASETDAFRPRSPYGAAKAAAFWAVAEYRAAYGLHASSGILFNHESPLRPERYVTRKVVAAAARIAGGSRETLRLGDLSVRRDWGWAPDYVEAMWAMLQRPKGDDFVVATGRCHALGEFVEEAFRAFGLRWKDHVAVDRSLYRPLEIRANAGDARKAARLLRWKAKVDMRGVVRRMAEAEREARAHA